ncbi:MAG: OmpA family protein [Alphaproteobacteria bacterium]|nr:OmpA family protein [Alphaproteobacteria bacterium]
MKAFSTLVSLAAVVALSACADLNLGTGAFTADDDIAAAKSAQASGPFAEALRKDYLTFAEYERDVEYDWRDSGFHAAKAVQASGGTAPEISPISRWQLPETAVGRFESGMRRLEAAFADGGRESNPAAASKAQTFFECWAEEQEENHQEARIAYCWSGFEAAMAELEASEIAEPLARDYLVFFDFDSTSIRSDTAQILNQVIEAFKALNASGMTLTGHTDRAGSSDYNQALSVGRAISVEDYLTNQGIPASDLTTAGRGESDPRVSTPDGVREQENRRVEINIQ